MRVFLIAVIASVVPSILFWNFGFARKIWPSHPLIMTTLVAMGIGIAVQKLLPQYLTPKRVVNQTKIE